MKLATALQSFVGVISLGLLAVYLLGGSMLTNFVVDKLNFVK